MTRRTQEQLLIDDFFAKGGKVTQCPPRTYARPPGDDPMSWREMQSANYERFRRMARLAKAKEVEEPQELVQVGPVVAPEMKAAYVRKSRAKPAWELVQRVRSVSDKQIVDALRVMSEKTNKEIADHLGISTAYLSKRRREINAPKRKNPRYNEISNDEIFSLIRRGMSIPNVADELGLAAGTVMSRIKRAGKTTESIRNE